MRKWLIHMTAFLLVIGLVSGVVPVGRFGYINGNAEVAEAKSIAYDKLPSNFPMTVNGLYYNYDAYSYKGYIYCSYTTTDDPYTYTEPRQTYIYRMKSDGTHLKRIHKLSAQGNPKIMLVCGNNIFMSGENESGDIYIRKNNGHDYGTCKYNLKTKKEKYYKRGFNGISQIDKKYYIAQYQAGDYTGGMGVAIINGKNGKIVFWNDNSCFMDAKVIGKTIYYTGFYPKMSSNGQLGLCACNLKGKNKRIIAKTKGIGGGVDYLVIKKVKGKRIYLSNDAASADYVYNISTKKLKTSTTKIYMSDAAGTKIFKKSKGYLIVRSDNYLHVWNFGEGVENQKPINKKKLKYKLASNCKWTFNHVWASDSYSEGNSSYKEILDSIKYERKVGGGTFAIMYYVKNNKIVRVNMGFS